MTGRINDPKTGGTTDYYLINVRHPRRQEAPCKIDVDDLSAVLKPTPEEFNILKAIVRSCNARLGNGKPGYDDLDALVRDAKKMEHYAKCNLKNLLDDQEDNKPQPAPQEVIQPEPAFKWINNTGRAPDADKVEIQTRAGLCKIIDPKKADWHLSHSPACIMRWRLTEE